MLAKAAAFVFMAVVVLLGCRQAGAEPGDEARIGWVEDRLRCTPMGPLTCEASRSPAKLSREEQEMRWARVLFAESKPDGTVRSLVIRSGRWPGSADTLWEYWFNPAGDVTQRSCLPNLPMAGARLPVVRAPDLLHDGRVYYSDRCGGEGPEEFWLEGGALHQMAGAGLRGSDLRLVSGRNAAGRCEFMLEGGALDQAEWKPRPWMVLPRGMDSQPREALQEEIRGVPATARATELDEIFLPVHIRVGPGPLRAHESEGWGAVSDAGVVELLWLATKKDDSDTLARMLLIKEQKDPRWLGLGMERELARRFKEKQPAHISAQEKKDLARFRSRIDWIRKKYEAGETAFAVLRAGQALQGKSVLLGSPGRLVVEAGGIPLLFEVKGSLGARVEVEPVNAMSSSWRAFSRALERQGWREPVLASPPFFLADRTLYRVDEKGVSVECRKLLLADGCTGACGNLRDLGTTYAEGGLLFIWSGGAKVGTCLDAPIK